MISRSLPLSALALLAAAQVALGTPTRQNSEPGPSGPNHPAAVGAEDFFVGRGETERRRASHLDAADQAQVVVRRYPLRGVLPAIDTSEFVMPLVAAPGCTQWTFEDKVFNATDLNPEVDLDTIVDLLSEALGDDLRFEGRALEVVGGDLMLMAPADVQAKAAALLNGLSGAMGAHANVTLEVLTLENGLLPFPANAQVSDEEAQRLVALGRERGASYVRHELTVTPGNMAVSDMTRSLSLITDYDVEIAQQAGIWDPIRTEVELGQRAVLRGNPVGDKLQVAALVRTVDLLGDVRERPLVTRMLLKGEQTEVSFSDGPQSIQHAEVAMHAYAFSGELGGGRALVCASELNIGGVSRSQMVVVRALSVQGQVLSRTPIGTAGRALLVVNTDAFAPTHARTWSILEDLEYGLREAAPFFVSQLMSAAPTFILDFLNYRFSVSRSVGPWALIVTDPAWDREGGDELQRLAAEWPSPLETASLALELGASGVADAIPARGLVPVARGKQSAVVVGMARSILWDYDVEVASGSAVADPVVGTLFSGLGAIVTSNGGNGIKAVVDAEAYGFLPSGGNELLEIDAHEFRYFDRQDRDVVRIRGQRAAGSDGVTTFGTSAFGTSRQMLQLRATIQ